MDQNIAARLADINNAIENAAKKYHRSPNSVSLLAASKGQSLTKINAAYGAGQRLFGENYLQEALQKITALSNRLDIEWHFIGNVQRNKTRKIAEHFAWVHSVSDSIIAKRLSEQRPSHLEPLNICIEVNIDSEPSKCGIAIDKIATLASFCKALPNLRLRGLMGIPAIHRKLAQQRKSFCLLAGALRALNRNDMQLDTLSMGMSDDFEAAIAEGATLVRVGRAIFGECKL